MTHDEQKHGAPSSSTPSAAIEVFFDGDCPLCIREMRTLKKMDRRGRIAFTDLAAPGFDAREVGVPFEDLMDRIHAREPDGTVLEGVEVFRRLYTLVGFGWLVAPTRLPGISHLLDLGYRLFAKNRLRLTGRCHDGACEVPTNRQLVLAPARIPPRRSR